MTANSVRYLHSELLTRAGFRHGFFTRQAGVSEPPFNSLNLSHLVGDSPEAVLKNRQIVAESLGIFEQHLYYPHQVHGVKCAQATQETEAQVFERQEADSVLSSSPEVGAAIRTADCVPILIAQKDGAWVAAVHAGWRGCVQNAVGQAVAELQAQGAQRFIAAIGPHISQESFEVDEKTAATLLEHSPDPSIVDRTRTKPHVSLRKMVRAQLLQAGLLDEEIDDVEGCTVKEEKLYFSYRRDAEASGRQISVIVSRGEPV